MYSTVLCSAVRRDTVQYCTECALVQSFAICLDTNIWGWGAPVSPK
jgi:hypothetical protein